MIIMKGVVNIEFVLSILVFLSTITFVSFIVISNIPYIHHESISEHIKSRAYQVSYLLLFDEGHPTDWNENTVAKLGLSNGNPYELDEDKIADLNDLCGSDKNRTKELLGNIGLYIDINVTKVSDGSSLTPNCFVNETGLRFTVTRFAVMDVSEDIVKMHVTVIAK